MARLSCPTCYFVYGLQACTDQSFLQFCAEDIILPKEKLQPLPFRFVNCAAVKLSVIW